MRRTYGYFAALVGTVCVAFILAMLFLPLTRTVRSDVLQGFLIGFGLAFVTAQAYARIKAVRVNGWITMPGLGDPGNGVLMRAACAQLFPGPVNTPEEAVYWWANTDATGRELTGRNRYVLRFPPGGLPPNNAFWSLTMGDARNRFVPNPLRRYSVSDRSGLVPGPDGSVEVFIRATPPEGGTSNWLPAPSGKFILWLRVYEPGPEILSGHYVVPPVARAGGPTP
ncbi:DUF1214 domain-containing protein [Pseudarthrobacter enclensis]|uniref:DUF1214 domain-containing protein n=1 Tax=Pseudarthrobacter enclensis TaxID=993070 RepID=A0ABT9RTZ9_9MICC|nr:DUF1214 domain-containing protein [Pseudarthrobacter enclensis]MDP9888266.1 hypothetical protein [Pseudarthrobacter enclensis]